jgi:hypothetical protein
MIGVVSVDGVVLRSHEYNIVNSMIGHVETGNVQRLAIDFPIGREHQQLPELHGIHIGGSESGFREVLTGVEAIIAKHQYIRLRETSRSACDKNDKERSSQGSSYARFSTGSIFSDRLLKSTMHALGEGNTRHPPSSRDHRRTIFANTLL